MMDLFVTSLTAAGLEVPGDRAIDGKDIMPLLTSDAASPHDALLSMRGNELCSVRSGRWKLFVHPPGPPWEKVWKPDEEWLDPRRPDGVRMLAPYEQAHPSAYPGLMTGDKVGKLGLFDLEADPTEQHEVADEHPDQVRRLQAIVEDYRRQRERGE